MLVSLLFLFCLLSLSSVFFLCLFLSQIRLWSSAKEPRWLVFEVENRFQIRPEQYAVVTHLLEKPGSISQLNMGRGKTRVLIPMLVLHMAGKREELKRKLRGGDEAGKTGEAEEGAKGSGGCRSRRRGERQKEEEEEMKDRLLRIILLGPLLSEGVHYLHGCLTASSLLVPVMTQPFHRDVQLTADRVRTIRQHSAACMAAGGIQVLAPHHMLSFKLKLSETLYGESDDSKSSEGLSEELSLLLRQLRECSRDLFDESDALLSPRYQLVYAMGQPAALPDCQTRALVCEAVMRVLNTSKTVACVLAKQGVCVQSATPSKCQVRGFALSKRSFCVFVCSVCKRV